MSARDFDLVLYGASGFVGRLAAKYLAQHADAKNLRWAIAGRDAGKLAALHDELAAFGASPDTIVADAQDAPGLSAMATRTQVVLDFAGPYALYGDAIVAACVHQRTHFVDITGETPWIRGLIDRHHERAADEGTRIVNCCGFDSVPSDIGALAIARYAQRALGSDCVQVKGYFRMRGGFNGGTLASALTAHEQGHPLGATHPFFLSPASAARELTAFEADVTRPGYDVEVDTWVGPFLMAPINTRIVRRSAALYADWREPYGKDFRYQEVAMYRGSFAPLTATAFTGGMALFDAALRSETSRRLLKPWLPAPGSGPSEASMESGWFRCDLLGRLADGRRVIAKWRHQGDPGNRATVKFACEAALTLVLDRDALPGGPGRGGVLTPATALGEVYVDRLQRAGVPIELSSG